MNERRCARANTFQIDGRRSSVQQQRETTPSARARCLLSGPATDRREPQRHFATENVQATLLVGALSDCLSLTFTLQAHQLHQVPRFVD